MEIVIGEGARGANIREVHGEEDELVKGSLLAAYVMMFDLILSAEGRVTGNHSFSPPQPWRNRAAVPSALENERSYREKVLKELARRQKGRETFDLRLDVLGVIDRDGPAEAILLERWHLISRCHQAESLSTDVVRILNRRLMTLIRTLYALLVTLLPTILPVEAYDAGMHVKFYLCDGRDDGDDGYSSRQISSKPQHRELVSHSHSTSSIHISVQYFVQDELREVLSSISSNEGRRVMRSLPLSPFDECLVNDEDGTIVSMTEDSVLADYFFADSATEDESRGTQGQEIRDRVKSLQAFFLALSPPSAANAE